MPKVSLKGCVLGQGLRPSVSIANFEGINLPDALSAAMADMDRFALGVIGEGPELVSRLDLEFLLCRPATRQELRQAWEVSAWALWSILAVRQLPPAEDPNRPMPLLEPAATQETSTLAARQASQARESSTEGGN